MHILVLSDFFPPQFNAGAENIAFEISKGYLAKGNRVSVITINKSLQKGELFVDSKKSLTCYQIGFNYNEKFSAYVGIYNPIVLKVVNEIILENDFEVAHLHNIHTYISYSVISLLKKYSIPSVLTVHDSMCICYGKYNQGVFNGDTSLEARVDYKVNQLQMFFNNWKRYNFFRNLIIRHQFKKLKKVVCVSKELEFLLNANGIKNTKVIHNGVSEPLETSIVEVNNYKIKMGISPKDKILLFAGRISVAKGFQQIESLIKRVISYDENIKLLIVGKELNLNNKINKNIINTGWISKDEMNLVYSVSNLTIVPSIYLDPFPTVALEAMSKGVPVIASVYSGAREAVINGYTGYHVNPLNIQDFVRKTIRILDDEFNNSVMSKNSKQEFKKRFTIGDCTKQYLKLFQNK
ncbi:glycosyltransferase family 4 protein [Candidatus Pseudothioglobus singularis]|jgi:glycosyltransferase involved in cell wall biosynthesis|nr:glycosyltransferase family 4 protein [Candidatus Pseudothioglobus singularis]